MLRGRHLLVDCSSVPYETCVGDGHVLDAIAEAAKAAGAHVISQVRYRFGHESPPGFTAAVLLDESHCTIHTYADMGLLALDIFTCGAVDPIDILTHLQRSLDLGVINVSHHQRFNVRRQHWIATGGAQEEI